MHYFYIRRLIRTKSLPSAMHSRSAPVCSTNLLFWGGGDNGSRVGKFSSSLQTPRPGLWPSSCDPSKPVPLSTGSWDLRKDEGWNSKIRITIKTCDNLKQNMLKEVKEGQFEDDIQDMSKWRRSKKYEKQNHLSAYSWLRSCKLRTSKRKSR